MVVPLYHDNECRNNQEKHTGANMLICAYKIVSISGKISATERAYESDRPYRFNQ
jgi:hypothetical protein